MCFGECRSAVSVSELLVMMDVLGVLDFGRTNLALCVVVFNSV